MIEAFPLYWPEGKQRTESWRRRRATFDAAFAKSRDEIVREIKLLTGSWPDPKIVISTNIALRRDGLPLANQRKPDDPGVAVYFLYKKAQRCFACDRWDRIEDNMQAIAKTIEALRGIERWGSGDMVDAAFAGFTALPPPDAPAPAGRPWWQVLGVQAHAPTADVQAAYRRLASDHHPDRGGSNERMAEINAAFDAFRRERGLE